VHVPVGQGMDGAVVGGRPPPRRGRHPGDHLDAARRGGYEHFELASTSNDLDEPTLVGFRRTMRTKIA
jgi:hypothetical protein